MTKAPDKPRAPRRRPVRDEGPPVERREGDRKADVVARDLIAQIASGSIPVGSILPKEAELAARYEVNRGVIREAVKLLEVHRLAKPVRRRGTVVLEPLHSMSPEVLVAMLVPRPGHVDRKVLSAFLEVRAMLDVEMTALAAERRTQADLKALRTELASLAAVTVDPRAYATAVTRLPLLVAHATKNPVFEMLAAFNGRVIQELDALAVATRPPSREHVEGLGVLVDVIESKDQDAARKIVSAFHTWSIPKILASAALASAAPPTPVPPRRSPR